ncbi:MAG: hypothetical protein JWN57_497 [Frankiales bacterium]|jgi:uncharacterized small protein (DUF1192 family)|nr:hypothetical protein [Frankiales bacterium]
MAKALFGHVGIGNDLRLLAEVRRLRGRVAELEAQVARLHAHETVTDDDLRLLTLDEQLSETQPAFS